MAADTATRTDREHMELLGRLLATRGLDRYGLYLLTSEGRFTPTGYEEMSGYVLGPDGEVRFFWTGWDDAGQADAFTVWRTAEARPDWLDDEEFRDAYAAATGEDAGAAVSRVHIDRDGIVRLDPEIMEPPPSVPQRARRSSSSVQAEGGCASR